MPPKRITIIPYIQGKIGRDGKLREPDMDWIIEQWLERHPQVKKRQRDIRVVRGACTLHTGIKTDLIHVSIVAGDDVAGYEPAQDQDLYAYFLAEDQDG
jgi:hypothetical protein